MMGSHEVEVKFRVDDVDALERKLCEAGFRQKTPPTREINTLYDLPGNPLRLRGEILRLRDYGGHFKLTHKSKGKNERHKTRIELETSVSDGSQVDGILRALGYSPIFVYEKFRSEWSDGLGEVVVDRTPIGNLAEIEGSPEWIDATAAKIGVAQSEYITLSYGALFEEWRQRARSRALNMTFSELNIAPPY